jgi:hypothetical protein
VRSPNSDLAAHQAPGMIMSAKTSESAWVAVSVMPNACIHRWSIR